MLSRKSYHIKISFLIFSCVLSNLISGCGRPFIRSEKYEAQKIEKKKNNLLKRHREVAAELKIIDNKLDDAAGKILIYTAKQNKSRVMSIEERKTNNEYIKKVADAENETKDLKIKSIELSSELKEIDKNLKELGYPLE